MPLRPSGGYAEQDLVPSGARTTSGATDIFANYGEASTLRIQLNVSAASGTSPTLNIVVEDTLDGSNWNPIATFAQKVAAGREVLDVTGVFCDRVRVRWTIGGTAPSFTFAVSCASQTPPVA